MSPLHFIQGVATGQPQTDSRQTREPQADCQQVPNLPWSCGMIGREQAYWGLQGSVVIMSGSKGGQ